jgi:hypothetical protein
MEALTGIKNEVDRLAARIGATGSVLPTYGHTEDLARPHIEVDSRGYHYVVVERGQELERWTTRDLDDLLFRVFSSITFSLAFEYEAAHRGEPQDCRRVGFQRQVELLAQLSKGWAEREAENHERILREHPFDDIAVVRAQLSYEMTQAGHAPEVAWLRIPPQAGHPIRRQGGHPPGVKAASGSEAESATYSDVKAATFGHRRNGWPA